MGNEKKDVGYSRLLAHSKIKRGQEASETSSDKQGALQMAPKVCSGNRKGIPEFHTWCGFSRELAEKETGDYAPGDDAASEGATYEFGLQASWW